MTIVDVYFTDGRYTFIGALRQDPIAQVECNDFDAFNIWEFDLFKLSRFKEPITAESLVFYARCRFFGLDLHGTMDRPLPCADPSKRDDQKRLNRYARQKKSSHADG